MHDRPDFLPFISKLKARIGPLWPAGLTLVLAAAFSGRGDKAVALTVVNMPDALAAAAVMLSMIAQPAFLLPACILLSVAASIRPRFMRVARYGLFGFSCASGALVAAVVLKHAIGRARPVVGSDLDPFVFRPFSFSDAYASFPSAQAACAVAALVAVGRSFPKLRFYSNFLAAVLCGARVLTGEHWISDVLVGWAVGWLMVLILAPIALHRS